MSVFEFLRRPSLAFTPRSESFFSTVDSQLSSRCLRNSSPLRHNKGQTDLQYANPIPSHGSIRVVSAPTWLASLSGFRMACVMLMLMFLTGALSMASNRTIDDQLGDSVTGERAVYLPNTIWTLGSECAGCFARPDPARTFDHTWHDATIHNDEPRFTELNISMKFTGIAVYAYCVLINANNDSWPLYSNLSFSIDGTQVGSYYHESERTDLYTYDALVYSNSSIPNGNHTFVIHLPRSVHNVAVLFDYVQYTYDDAFTPTPSGSSSTPTSNNTGVSSGTSNSPIKYIVGGVVGGVAAILFLVGAIVATRRHHGRPRRGAAADPLPVDTSAYWQPPVETQTLEYAPLHQYTGLSPDHNTTEFSPMSLITGSSPHVLSYTDSSSPRALSYAESSAAGSSFVPEQAMLMQGLQQRLDPLQSPSVRASEAPGSVSSRPSARSAEVEELRQEVERLRKLLTNTGAAPPGYEK